MKRKISTSPSAPIGIFDSGLGGLTIFKALRKLLPSESLIYFGDSAHVPYGSKSKETVTRFSLEISRFLESKDIKLLIIACNTASALALEEVIKNVSVPVIGVITPGARAAARATENKKIAVIGTEATVNSGAYAAALKKINKNLKVASHACPLFVPLIEENFAGEPAAKLVIEKYLAPLKKAGADTLILGCTHYPIIKKEIKKYIGGGVKLIDSADAVAREAREILRGQNLLSSRKAVCTVYASDAPERFLRKAKKILGLNIKKVLLKKIS